VEECSREQLLSLFVADLEEVDALEVAKSCDAVLGFCLWIHRCSLQESEALLFIFVDLLMPKQRLLRD
jgi:hypothetical protein